MNKNVFSITAFFKNLSLSLYNSQYICDHYFSIWILKVHFPESLGLHFNYKAMDGGDHGLCNPHQCESKKANISGLGMLSFFCMETLTPGFTQIMSQLCHLIVV